MLLSLRKNSLDSLFKEVRVFKGHVKKTSRNARGASGRGGTSRNAKNCQEVRLETSFEKLRAGQKRQKSQKTKKNKIKIKIKNIQQVPGFLRCRPFPSTLGSSPPSGGRGLCRARLHCQAERGRRQLRAGRKTILVVPQTGPFVRTSPRAITTTQTHI